MDSPFVKGLRDGLPIGLGYLSVALGFGILSVRSGLSVFAAVLISMTNLTSAGQAAGVGVIAAGGAYVEMALTQLVINIRYSLMGISLSQQLDPSFTVPQRLIVSYGITDEIFAVASAQREKLTARYMYGMILISFLGWSAGTFIGAYAGHILPKALTDAMGILLYGMFLAVIIPAARKDKGALAVVCAAAVLSVLFKYVFTMVSGGFAIIICAILAAALGAALFPVAEEGEGERE